jgi:hypothetical protein
MPVTTRRQSPSLAQPNAMDEGERNRSEDRSSETPRESDDDDDSDIMDGSLAELSSSEDDDDASEDEHVSGLSEGEESDTSEFGDPFEGILHSRRNRAHRTNRVHTASNAHGKAP